MKEKRFRADHTSEQIFLEEFVVLRKTPRGAWIQSVWGGKERFVLDYGRKRFAYPTPEDALVAFEFRKISQVKILEANLENAKIGVELARKYRAEGLVPGPLSSWEDPWIPGEDLG